MAQGRSAKKEVRAVHPCASGCFVMALAKHRHGAALPAQLDPARLIVLACLDESISDRKAGLGSEFLVLLTQHFILRLLESLWSCRILRIKTVSATLRCFRRLSQKATHFLTIPATAVELLPAASASSSCNAPWQLYASEHILPPSKILPSTWIGRCLQATACSLSLDQLGGQERHTS